MKAGRIFLLTGAALTMLVAAGIFAQDRQVSKANEELSGTWTNEKSINTFHIQKMIIAADQLKEYHEVSDASPYVEATQQIDGRWSDSEGELWYKISGRIKTGPWGGRNYKALLKLTVSASVLEMVVSANDGDSASFDYPAKIEKYSAYNGGYRLFHRALTKTPS